MRVAITGGSGFVGRNVVAALLDGGSVADIRALVRDRPSAVRALPAGVELRVVDVTRPDTLRGAFDGVAALVHTVAIPTQRGRSTFERVNAERTRALVRAAQAAG